MYPEKYSRRETRKVESSEVHQQSEWESGEQARRVGHEENSSVSQWEPGVWAEKLATHTILIVGLYNSTHEAKDEGLQTDDLVGGAKGIAKRKIEGMVTGI